MQPKMLGAVESLPATAFYQGVLYSKDPADTSPDTKTSDIDPSQLVFSKQVDPNVSPVANIVLIRNNDGTITQRDKITGDTATFSPEGGLISQNKSLYTRANEFTSAIAGTGVAGIGGLGESISQAARQIGKIGRAHV